MINVPGAELVEAVRVCGSISGRKDDKFEAAVLTRRPSSQVVAMSVAECGAQIECRVEREIAFEERTWFVGAVVSVRQREGHSGALALMCGRYDYRLPGDVIAPR